MRNQIVRRSTFKSVCVRLIEWRKDRLWRSCLKNDWRSFISNPKQHQLCLIHWLFWSYFTRVFVLLDQFKEAEAQRLKNHAVILLEVEWVVEPHAILVLFVIRVDFPDDFFLGLLSSLSQVTNGRLLLHSRCNETQPEWSKVPNEWMRS